MKDKIAIVIGSKNDLGQLQEGVKLLEKLKISHTLDVISAHRNPEKLRKFCQNMEKKNIAVVIAGAGKAAALPGFIASYVDLPVIGFALKGGLMDGLDALFSIISTPRGLGLVCSGVGSSAFINAVIVALEILGLKDKKCRLLAIKVKNKFR